MGKKVQTVRHALYRPFLFLGIIFGIAAFIVDIVFLSYFYLNVRGDYSLLEGTQTCPIDSAPLCCGAIEFCPTHPNATTTDCVDSFDWNGRCCQRTDHVGFFFVVVVLFFFIFSLQIIDLISKVILYRNPVEHFLVKIWEVILNLGAVVVACVLLGFSIRSMGESVPDCYSDPQLQNALASTVSQYKNLFNLSVIEVTVAAILMTLDFVVLCNCVKPSETLLLKTKEKRKAKKEKRKAKKQEKLGNGTNGKNAKESSSSSSSEDEEGEGEGDNDNTKVESISVIENQVFEMDQ